MTVRDFLSVRLQRFGDVEYWLSEYEMRIGADTGASLDDTMTPEVEPVVGRTLVGVLAELILAPKQKSVSESGFSVSWDFDSLVRYYLWLCRKYGIAPEPEITEMTSVIRDASDKW